MSKKAEKQSEKFPVELPSRNSEVKRSPIVDVAENEIYPLDFENMRQESGVHFEQYGDISEVVATEIKPDMAGQTTHVQQM